MLVYWSADSIFDGCFEFMEQHRVHILYRYDMMIYVGVYGPGYMYTRRYLLTSCTHP